MNITHRTPLADERARNLTPVAPERHTGPRANQDAVREAMMSLAISEGHKPRLPSMPNKTAFTPRVAVADRRTAILAFIEANPGTRAEDLPVDVGRDVRSRDLRHLRKAGLIHSVKDGPQGSYRHYAGKSA